MWGLRALSFSPATCFLPKRRGMASDWLAVAIAEPKQVLIHVVADMEEVCMDAVAVSVVVPAPPPMCAANGAATETPHFLSPTTARASAQRPSFPKGPTCAWSWHPRSLGQEPAATMSRGHSGTMTKATTGVTRKSSAE
uniref:Uncharacterized protein n=1 Tax=Oryza barthii TaxID=65489 RepID=A0A0D3HAN5_9ORYZ